MWECVMHDKYVYVVAGTFISYSSLECMCTVYHDNSISKDFSEL